MSENPFTPDDIHSSPSSEEETWQDIFPFEEPYEQQKDGIKRTNRLFKKGGIALLEGACGTGKTLISLSAAIDVVRDNSTQYERVLCMTSVKQQLRAFEDDVEAINENLPDDEPPVRALSLVGKADMCSYTDVGLIQEEEIYGVCDSLRDESRQMKGSNGSPGKLPYALNDWESDEKTLGKKGDWESPYIPNDPRGNNSPAGCPFYIKYLQKTIESESSVGVFNLDGLYRPERLKREASEQGMCPHSVMGIAIDQAEVIIGNYRHAFDPLTAQSLMSEVIDNNTIVVCDEAHTMVSVVRDLVSETMSHSSIETASNQIENYILNPDSDSKHQIREELISNIEKPKETIIENFEYASEVFDFVSDYLQKKTIEAFEDEYGRNWKNKVTKNQMKSLEKSIRYPLREPTVVEEDDLKTELNDRFNLDDEEYLSEFKNILTFCNNSTEYLIDTQDPHKPSRSSIGSTSRKLIKWIEEDNEKYFRTVDVERRNSKWYDNPSDIDWKISYKSSLAMHNCIPSEIISETLNEFGAGLVMSATLEPLDVYKEVIGLDTLESKRPVRTFTYGLDFPPENRESIAVESIKFTGSNRGNPNEYNETREQYERIITEFTDNVEGNALICMPSYAEARWAAECVEYDPYIDKEVLIDESSTNEETEQMKKEFFNSDNKVMVTSMRGTLTEGVDYSGERLSGVLVCGVPIRSMAGPLPDAIKTAYVNQFGSDWKGFSYAFAVPAARKARQALGRVIRGNDDVGVRVLADERYARGYMRQYLPDYERNEYNPTDIDDIEPTLKAFWERQDKS